MAPVPDLVKVSKLDANFLSDPQCTQHIVEYVPEGSRDRRKVRKEERWKREKRLGCGTFGIVWLERCTQGDKKNELRAVKELPKQGARNYNRELEAIALFSHAQYRHCFVQSFGWYENEEDIFLAMEFLANGDLNKYLRSPFTEREAQSITTQILEGLHFMHGHGFAHRDLKPENILVVCTGPDWWVKIADFGISKRATEGDTALRTLTGTPAFAAPEILFFHVPIDGVLNQSYTNAVDIWSLSVIIYLMLTTKFLFKDTKHLIQYVHGDLEFSSDELSAHKVSEHGCDFLKRTMRPKPEDRLQVEECRQHPWLQWSLPESNSQSDSSVPSSPADPQDFPDPRPSASPTTQHQFSASSIVASKLGHGPTDLTAAQPSASWTTQDQLSASSVVAPTLRPGLPDQISIQPSASWSTQHEIAAPGVDVLTPESQRRNSMSTEPEPTIPQRWSELYKFKGHEGSLPVFSYSPDGKQLAFASNKNIKICDPTRRVLLKSLKGHSELIGTIVYSPDGKQLASGSHDNTVKIWDSITGALLKSLEDHSESIKIVVYSPDSKQLMSGSYAKTIKIWDAITGVLLNTIQTYFDGPNSITYAPNGNQLAVGTTDKTIQIWDPKIGVLLISVKGYSDLTFSHTFSPDSKQLASRSRDNTIDIWNPTTGVLLKTLKGHSGSITTIVYSPDGKQLASGAEDRTVKIWDPITGALLNTMKVDYSPLYGLVVYSPNGKQLAFESCQDIEIRDPIKGTRLHVLKVHSSWIRAIVYSPDGKQLASGSTDKTVRIWSSTKDYPDARKKTLSEGFKRLFR